LYVNTINMSKSQNPYIRFLLILIPLSLAFLVLYWLSDIVTYILISWVISMLGSPIMDLLRKKGKLSKYAFGDALYAMVTLILMISLLTGIGVIFVPIIIEQAANLSQVDTNAILGALEEPMNALMSNLQSMGLVAQESNPEKQAQEELIKWFEPAKISQFLGSFFSIASNLMIGIFSVLFISFFFLKEQGLFTKMLYTLTPNSIENKVRVAVEDISALLTRYFGGIVIQISIIAIYLSILLSLVGVQNALLIAVFAAFINVIPYLGPLIGAIFGVMLTITSSLDLDFYTQMLPLLIKVVLSFMSMQLLDNFVLQPIIFSNSVRAHPLEIFLAIMIGAKVGGIGGMILAIPAYTVIRVIARTFLSEFELAQKFATGLSEPKELPNQNKDG